MQQENMQKRGKYEIKKIGSDIEIYRDGLLTAAIFNCVENDFPSNFKSNPGSVPVGSTWFSRASSAK